MRLVEQWRRIESELPQTWQEARLVLRLAEAEQAKRAAALLGPAAPGRSDCTLRFTSARAGGAPGPDAIRRLLGRLDAQGMSGELELLGSIEADRPAERPRETLPLAWRELLDGLPADWSDLYVQIALLSSDHVDPAALALAPTNPTRHGDGPVLRFRVARRTGYGAAPEMVERCLQRLEERHIPGTLTAVRVMSDSDTVQTQGPVWYIGGRAV